MFRPFPLSLVALLLSFVLPLQAEKDSDYIQATPVGTPDATTMAPPSGDFKGIRAALDALPQKYRAGVIKVSADGGNPDPHEWYILAHNSEKKRLVYSLTVNHADITDEKLSHDPRAIIGRHTSIDLSKVTLDTHACWLIAQNFVQSKNKSLGSISYVLDQDGKDAAPTWSLWCYSRHNGYIGMIKILATTGDVVLSK